MPRPVGALLLSLLVVAEAGSANDFRHPVSRLHNIAITRSPNHHGVVAFLNAGVAAPWGTPPATVASGTEDRLLGFMALPGGVALASFLLLLLAFASAGYWGSARRRRNLSPCWASAAPPWAMLMLPEVPIGPSPKEAPLSPSSQGTEREEFAGAFMVTDIDHLGLSDDQLLHQCRVDTFRASGPGGQHRNKTDSAVRITHLPTGIVAQAFEDRSQLTNRAKAVRRLRKTIALQVRLLAQAAQNPTGEGEAVPVLPPELAAILPVKGRKEPQLGPKSPDFAKGVQRLLTLLEHHRGALAECAAQLGISTGQLSKVITSDRDLMVAVNALRARNGRRSLRL
eukprot:GGOE01045000.1.p2 GENE.GGOE01045000.1~~GGOE01045000.1.p2  ORF type:complete len:340 (-),score=68.65 GGOE01045000.1:196-1215(-)